MKNQPNTKRDDKINEWVTEAHKIKKQFDSCQNYKNTKNILDEAKRGVEFYEGRQWNEFRGKLPFEKPVANVVANIIDSKVASINQKTFKINYRVDNDQITTNKVTSFAEYQTKEMEQTDCNVNATYDSLMKGTFIWYYYWDNEAIGLLGKIEGALKCVNIDVEDIAVSNPTEKDIQKQEWVILRSRESLKVIKSQCKTLNTDEEKDKYITKNDQQSVYYKNVEQDNEECCYSYLKFFRQNGEVYYTKSTDNVVYQEATSINPLINAEAIKREKRELYENKTNYTENEDMYEVDGTNRQTMTEGSEFTEQEMFEAKYKATLYPFVMDSLLRRNNCIFGRSLAYQIIPMQKIINQLIAINALSAIKAIMPTLVVKQGATGIDNVDLSKPGGVIIDKMTGTNGRGIEVLQTPQLSANHFQLAQEMISLLKDIYRASDILDDGRNLAKNMSGYAMSQLQTIQDKPVAQMQEILSRAIAREGRILEMFYKLYYHNKTYSYQLTDTELLKENPNAQDVTELARTRQDIFEGDDYLETPFNVTVEIEETARQSELMLTATLETLFLNGTIEKISPEYLMAWAELVPSYAFTKKDEFKRLVQQHINSENAQLKAKLQEAMSALEQSQAYNESLRNEFTNKVNQYNENIKRMQTDYEGLQKMFRNSRTNQTNNDPSSVGQ